MFHLTEYHRYKEKSKDEPGTTQKIEDLVAFTKASKFGMMTTKNVDTGLLVSRCMAVAASVSSDDVPKHLEQCINSSLKENGGIDLIFHTNTESGKTDDLEKDGNINMSFVNGTGEWASISGKASIITDRSAVKKYYSPELKAWLGDLGDGKHDGSENDPRIGLIKIEAKTATYALSTGTMISRGYEIVKGAVTGDTAQVNKLREISEQEIQQYRSSH